MTVQAFFTLAKTTPGAYKYEEIDPSSRRPLPPNVEGSKIGTLYIRKTAFNNNAGAPVDIIVTIEPAPTK